MYSKYNYCPPQTGGNSIPYCPPQRITSEKSAIPESARMIAQQCSTVYVTTLAGPNYCTNELLSTNTSSGSSGSTAPRVQKITVPVAKGAPLPIVEVGTIPQSVLIQQKAAEVMLTNSNPYNPATRFAEYFPPAPIPYVCPERIPNNFPQPSTRPCIDVTNFRGSKQ